MDAEQGKKSLQELVKQQLEAKKGKGAAGGKATFNDQPSMKMRSQQARKVGTTRRKMGV